jgi:polar amino acid transport system substrate-binding protein
MTRLRRIAVLGLGLLSALGSAAAQAQQATGGQMDRILQRGQLVVGVKADYPPWGMVAPDGRSAGLEIDLARDMADRLGVSLELVTVTAGNRLQLLAQGQVDLVIATLGDTEERQRVADLVRPHYYSSGVTLLTRRGSPFKDWGQLRGRPVCLSEGAFFNRVLAERYLIDPVVFSGTRDALLALRSGRCVGWAFDDTKIMNLLRGEEWAEYRIGLPSILTTAWAVAVRKGESDRAWGRFVADAVADWHRSGYLVDLQAKWGLPPHAFLAEQQAVWSESVGGALACARDTAGDYPQRCLDGGVARFGGADAELPPWAARLAATTGLNVAPLLDPFNQERLLRGIGLTLALSLVAIAGSLAVGVTLAVADRALDARPLLRPLRLPIQGLVTLARMTPPVLQLYILFFGLGGLMASRHGAAPGSFLVAAVVFSLYAGAANAVLLGTAMAQDRSAVPGTPAIRLVPAAIERCYEGLVSTSVNIVKAAGLASTIALPETISTVQSMVAEGADVDTMMNLLLVFYFLFVVSLMGVLHAAKRAVLGTR